MTGLIANRMSHRVDVLDVAVRVNNSIVCFEVRFLGNRFSEQFSDSVLVLRAKAPKEFFEPRRPGLWIETKHAISFLRPISDFTGGGRPGPTPGVAEPLRFGQIGFALPSGRFCQLTLNGDAGEMSNVLDRVLLTWARAPRLPIVHGKRPDHFAFGGKDRRGPTRAERMRQGQVAEISPQWIGRDVGDNYLFGAVSSRSTRADRSPNESSVDRFRISFRKIRRSAVSQLLAICIH